MLDARHSNSNTEQSDESWPFEATAPQLARANKKCKCAIDPLMRKPSSLQVFPLVTNSLLSFAVSMVSKDSQISLQNKCQFFTSLIEQGSAPVYFDDILQLSHSKEHMFHLIEQLHIISTKHNLELAPEKIFFHTS